MLLGWLRTTTHGGINVNLFQSGFANEILALVLLSIASGVLIYYYVKAPSSLKKYFLSPYTYLRKIYKVWSSRKSISDTLEAIAVTPFNLIISYVLLIIVLVTPAVFLNFFSLLALFLSSVLDITVYRIVIIGLFLSNTYLSWRLLK